mgnify:FL=1
MLVFFFFFFFIFILGLEVGDRGGRGELVVVGVGTGRTSFAVPAAAGVRWAGQHEWRDMKEYEEE